MNELYHHGIKGQRWGVRRTPEQLGHINGGTPRIYKLHNYRGKAYFISEKELDGQTLNPRVPENFLTKYGFEDNTTKRVCFSHDPGKCLTAMSSNVTGKTFNVYEPAKKHDIYKPNKTVVPDSDITGELWIMEPVKLKKVGTIKCTGDTGEEGMKYTYGNNKAELYDWNYEWVSKDGTRSALEKKAEFKKTTLSVMAKCSNKPNPIQKEKVDISKVMDRGKVSERDARTCAKLADKVFEKAKREEPKITSDLISLATSSGSKMYGLDHRLKQPTSIAGKIGSDSKDDGVSHMKAASGIKDAVRYTTVTNDKNFVKNYNAVKSGLEKQGYQEVKCKNYFEMYRNGEVQHKAVQATYRTPNGYDFEIQFQTPESQAAKELKIPIYEERRKQGIDAKRATELEQAMHDLAEQVPYPKGISEIKSHK